MCNITKTANQSETIEDHENGQKSTIFASKVPSLPSFRAFTLTSVMRKKKVSPYRGRVTQNCSQTRQTRQTPILATNCN